MPTYNRAWIIKRAIDSILAQSCKDWELIVIDDGSEDNTAHIVASYSDARIHYLKLDQNAGAGAARNRGLSQARGDIIAYLDSDNVWHPNYLEVMLSELTDEYLMAYSGQNLLLVGGTRDQPKILGRKTRTPAYNPDRLLYGNFIDINIAVHRASVIKEIGGFDESLKSLGDWDLFVRISVKHPFKIKYVDQVLGDYYFYLKAVSETITGAAGSEERTIEGFRRSASTPATAAVLKNIERYRREATA